MTSQKWALPSANRNHVAPGKGTVPAQRAPAARHSNPSTETGEQMGIRVGSFIRPKWWVESGDGDGHEFMQG